MAASKEVAEGKAMAEVGRAGILASPLAAAEATILREASAK